MAAEKNQPYLLVVLRTKICGIDPMKLITPEDEDEDEAVDWENLPPFPFDFSVDLPRGRMHAVELDSKIHLVGGLKYMTKSDYRWDHCFYPSKKVYELDLDQKEVKESKSMDDAPTFTASGFCFHTLHKIRSDYYFIMMGGYIPMDDPQNFWVLRSATNVWECLPTAPSSPFDRPKSFIAGGSWFDFYGKLYLRYYLENGRVYVYSYDTHYPLKDWTITAGDDIFTGSFCLPVGSDGQRRFFHPSVHIPDLVDPGKYLALSCECVEGKKVIYAFQVDELGARIFQRLEGCLDRMPSLKDEETPVLVDVDGKGTFVVMLAGFAEELRTAPVLCVLVLQVVAKKFVNHSSRILRRLRSPRECEFLDWKVLSMHMYKMKVDIDDLCAAFIFPGIPCDEAIVYQVPRRGKRKYSQI